MKTKRYFSFFAAGMMLLLGAASANAALIPMNGGLLVYDDDRNITWVANGNLNGAMSWDDADEWAEDLVYEGYDDWRLPATLVLDAGCTTALSTGYNCTGSEMGHLFYQELGNFAKNSDGKCLDLTKSNCGLLNTGPFNFPKEFFLSYWSGTTEESNAYYFFFDNGGQNLGDTDHSLYAFAVRDGGGEPSLAAVSAVPEPETLLLMGLGLAGLVGFQRKNIHR